MKLRHKITLLAVLLLAASAPWASAQAIALTWDDLPTHGALPEGETRLHIVQSVVAAMKAEHLPPTYGFINGVQTTWEPSSDAIFRTWVESGNLLGNHTWSHMNLDEHTVAQYEDEIQKNEPILKHWMGDKDWHWFRYPYLAEGKSAEQRNQIRDYLFSRGYRVAAVSLGFPDYNWTEPYARCVAKGNTAETARIEQYYLQAGREAAVYSTALARYTQGRDVPFVLLLHIGALDAKMLPRLLALYRQMGFTFVDLKTAESDPYYQADINLNGAETKSGAPRAGSKAPEAPVFEDFASSCR